MPASKGLKIDIRRAKILELLQRDGQVRVTGLAEELGATPVTIRTDLAALEQDGYLQRVAGGAVQTVKNFYTYELQQRTHRNARLKRAVAAATAALVQDGETLFLNAGTTTYYVAIELKRHKNLNVVTNSMSVAMELGDVPTFRVILIGGEVNAQYSFTYGATVLEQLQTFKADTSILSVDGVCGVGITTYHAEEVAIIRTMMERASKSIVAADHTKIGKESFSNIAPLSALQYLVVDEGVERSALEEIAAANVQIILG